MKVKNTNYEEGKQKLSEIVKEMNDLVEFHKQMLSEHELMGDYPPTYDEEEGRQFVKLMKTVNTLKPHERNLFLCFVSNNYNYKKTLEVFNGEGTSGWGKKYKSEKSLRVLIYKIKQKIHDKINESNTDEL